MIAAAAAAGVHEFGESYLTEALPKIAALQDPQADLALHRPACRPTRPATIAEHFAWVHALDRLKVAERLDAQRPPGSAAAERLPAGEPRRRRQQGRASTPAELPQLAAAVALLPRLRLRGLMCLPPPRSRSAAPAALVCAAARS